MMSAHDEYWPLSEQQRKLQQKAREFASLKIRPAARQLDSTAAFPTDIYPEMAARGLLGITIPEKWGGAGADTQSYALVMEEMSVGYAAVADLCGLVELIATLLLALGTDAQKERYLGPLLKAQTKCSFGLTEPDAGSDLASLTTYAEKTDEGYVLNGSKIFINNAPVCDFALVLARSREDGNRHGQMSIFIVDADRPGFSRGAKEHKMGQRASQLSSLFFKDCRLEADSLLGNEGDGFKNMMIVLEKGRIGIAALSLGIARTALEESVKFIDSCLENNLKTIDNQTNQFRLADMASDVFAARAMIRHAACLKDQDVPATTHASMAKLFASDMAVKNSATALQIQGMQGHDKSSIVERLYRDAKVTQIYEGTSEVQRIIISRSLQRKGWLP